MVEFFSKCGRRESKICHTYLCYKVKHMQFNAYNTTNYQQFSSVVINMYQCQSIARM